MTNKKILLILLTVLVVSISSPAQAITWLSGYEYRKEITIDHTKIGSDLSNFPLAVILSDTTNIVDGNDVKFTLSDGETKLDYEKEKYATDDAAYWVNIPSVSSGTDTTFYMYYGKTGDTDESTSDIWDSNYKMVQHLEETGTGTRYDSTSNNNDGSPQNYDGDEAATGKIDGADDFDGTNDFVHIPASSSLDIGSGNLSFEAWVKINDIGPDNYFILMDDNLNVISFIENGDYAKIFLRDGDGDVLSTNSTTALLEDTWYHLAGVREGSTARIYVNGVLENQTTNAAVGNVVTTDHWHLGVAVIQVDTHVAFFNGILDEIRISNTARSDDWIKASYNSGNGSLLTLGNEESTIPEPTSLLLLEFGIIGITVFKRRLTKI